MNIYVHITGVYILQGCCIAGVYCRGILQGCMHGVADRGLWWSRAAACQAFLLLPLWTLRPFFVITHAALLCIQIQSTLALYLLVYFYVYFKMQLKMFPLPLTSSPFWYKSYFGIFSKKGPKWPTIFQHTLWTLTYHKVGRVDPWE